MAEAIVRVGVLGAADIARRHMLPALASLPELFKVVAVGSRTRAKAEALAQPYGALAVEGYAELLRHDDLDLVYMPLPTALNAEWMPQALAAGKHVLAEKSLAPDAATAQAVVAQARAAKLLVMEDFMFVYHRQQQRVAQLLAEGAIGELRLMRASFCFPPLKADNFRYDPALAGGALMDAGGYVTRAAQLYLSDAIRVSAADLHYGIPGKADTRGAATLTDGQVTAQVAFGFEHFYQGGYELVGTAGKLSLERAFTAPPGHQARLVLEQQGRRVEETLPPDNHFVSLLRALHQAICTGEHDPHYRAVTRQAELLSAIRRLAGQ